MGVGGWGGGNRRRRRIKSSEKDAKKIVPFKRDHGISRISVAVTY